MSLRPKDNYQVLPAWFLPVQWYDLPNVLPDEIKLSIIEFVFDPLTVRATARVPP